MSRTKRNLLLMALVALQILTSGCDENERVARVATQAAERQAQQNQEMARLNREVAEGTRRLVEADAVARKEMLATHQEIQAERISLNAGFDQLEAERKQMARHRRTESVLVPAVKATGVTIFATAVVVFCLLLLRGLRNSDASAGDLSDLLIRDLVSEQPRLLSGPDLAPAIENNPVTDDSEPPLLSTTGHVTDDGKTPGAARDNLAHGRAHVGEPRGWAGLCQRLVGTRPVPNARRKGLLFNMPPFFENPPWERWSGRQTVGLAGVDGKTGRIGRIDIVMVSHIIPT